MSALILIVLIFIGWVTTTPAAPTPEPKQEGFATDYIEIFAKPPFSPIFSLDSNFYAKCSILLSFKVDVFAPKALPAVTCG